VVIHVEDLGIVQPQLLVEVELTIRRGQPGRQERAGESVRRPVGNVGIEVVQEEESALGSGALQPDEGAVGDVLRRSAVQRSDVGVVVQVEPLRQAEDPLEVRTRDEGSGAEARRPEPRQ
jgi:hypothetical protein